MMAIDGILAILGLALIIGGVLFVQQTAETKIYPIANYTCAQLSNHFLNDTPVPRYYANYKIVSDITRYHPPEIVFAHLEISCDNKVVR